MKLLRIFPPLLALALAAASLGGCSVTTSTEKRVDSQLSQPLREVRYVMGTLLDITLYPPAKSDGRAVLDEAFSIAERLDGSLSTYKQTSALSRFNSEATTSVQEVDPDLYNLVERAHELSLKTEGAFDVTVRPLVEVWNKASQRGYPPTSKELSALKSVVGYRKLSLKSPRSVSKAARGVQIESGGIGKGIAVDEIVTMLRKRDVSGAFINFGRSSMAAIGAPRGEPGWTVALELEEGRSEGEVVLRDEALTVSRARGEPFVVAGVSYAHIFNPLTLAPIKEVRGAAIRSASATDGEAYVKFLVLRGLPPKQVEKHWGEVQWFVKTQGTEMVSSTKR